MGALRLRDGWCRCKIAAGSGWLGWELIIPSAIAPGRAQQTRSPSLTAVSQTVWMAPNAGVSLDT